MCVSVCDVTRLSTARARAHIHVVLVYRTGAYSVAPAPADDRARSPSDSATTAIDAGIRVGVAIDCCCYYDDRNSRLCRFATIAGCVFGEFFPGNSSHPPACNDLFRCTRARVWKEGGDSYFVATSATAYIFTRLHLFDRL